MKAVNAIKTRRRGAELERALLDEAWNELVEHGYAKLTMEAVASRAGTSRSVLARRWDSRFSLTIAAIRQQLARYPLEVADRGEVRSELLAFLERVSERTAVIAVVFSLLASEYFQDSSSPPRELREVLIDGETNELAAILHRAVGRGEIDSQKLTPSIKTLLSDLFRHHAIMNLSAPSKELRTSWVDEIFLPLVRI
ncbi:TetR/AcrR family transcriptional regulator [Marinobacter nanhaiticus D15-8W]|uniref:TetR/AcrR family transcriptional regulator n=1 Tax=Marinobacter nanhaiticus D15-8W TaxID=626887 RepID=N6W1Q0_9GAMM|nr:TetR/AcrR family transcriptional regulator [Marinobacter nanhaiticus]ENO14034.1 TetR/AcrR family transcriptional regulator [Marinobacter nanhaiticus D15-8W]BES71414.1 TetR/AcrR family transcriptional regulator [Marinobacter nanhaiticus D15-8W]